MKRFISLFITAFMALTMVSAVGAETTVADKSAYPYIFLDFEKENDKVTGASWASWSDKGANGTKGSLYVSQTANVQDYGFTIPDYTFMAQSPVKLSAWVKLDTTKTKLRDDCLSLGYVFYGKSVADANATKWINMGATVATNNKLNSGEWVYFEKIFTWDGMMSDNQECDYKKGGSINPRLANAADGGVDKYTEDSPTKTISYWIDNICVEPVVEMPETDTSDEPVETTKLLNDKFSAGAGSLGGVTYVAENGPDGKTGYVNFTGKAGSMTQFTLGSYPFKYNKLYRISMKAKANDDETVGKKIRSIFMRNTRLDLTNDPKGSKGDSGGYEHFWINPALTKEWQDVTLYMKRSAKTFDESKISVWFRVGDDRVASAISIDDLVIEEFNDIVTNGDFEDLKTDIPATEHGYITEGQKKETEYANYGNFYGWFENGVTAETSTDKAADAQGSKSAKVTYTAADGSLNQSVFIPNNVEKEITFRIKGEGTTVGKKVNIRLDRDVATKDALDLYDTKTEVLGENLTLTNAWQTFKIPYTFAVKKPTDVAANVGPRQPYMHIDIVGAEVGDVYYIDDIAIQDKAEEPEVFEHPYLTNAEISEEKLVGSVVSFTSDFNCDNENKEAGVSYISVYSKFNGYPFKEALLVCDGTNFEYTLPDSLAGKEVSFDILPLTDDGVAGVTLNVPFGKVLHALEIKGSIGEFNEVDKSVTADYTFYNNDPQADTIDVFMAVVVYDGNGCAVRADYSERASVAAADSAKLKASVSTAEATEQGFSAISCVKVYIWGGTDVFNTNMTPYMDVAVKEK